jgi:hypothetical protein
MHSKSAACVHPWSAPHRAQAPHWHAPRSAASALSAASVVCAVTIACTLSACCRIHVSNTQRTAGQRRGRAERQAPAEGRGALRNRNATVRCWGVKQASSARLKRLHAPFKKARIVNSPGSARRAPARCQRRVSDGSLEGPQPCRSAPSKATARAARRCCLRGSAALPRPPACTSAA